MQHRRFGSFAAVVVVIAGVVTPAAAGTLDDIQVGNRPFGVALDPTTDFVWVANQTTDDVSVVDTAAAAEIARVPVGDGPRHIAVNPVTRRVFVTHPHSGEMMVIDADARAVIATITDVGPYPTAVALNTVTNTVYVASGTSSSEGGLYVIDGATLEIVASLTLPSSPVDVAIDEADDLVYVARWGYEVHAIDGTTIQEIDRFPLEQTGAPWSGYPKLAFDPVARRIHVVRSDRFTTFDTDGVVLGASDQNAASPVHDVTVDPVRGRVYVAGWSMGLRVFDGARSIELIPTPSSFTTAGVAVDPATRRVYYSKEPSTALGVFEDDLPEATLPGTPEGFDVTAGGEAGEIHLSWGTPDHGGTQIQGYRILRAIGDGPEELAAEVVGSPWTDRGLPSATQVTYRVRAVNGVGEGPATQPGTATTPRVPSGECEDGTAILDGTTQRAAFKARLTQEAEGIALCLRASVEPAGIASPPKTYGSKITLTTSEPAAPTTDDAGDACRTAQGNRAVLEPITVEVGPPADPGLAITVSSHAGASEDWLCLEVGGALELSARIILPAIVSASVAGDPPGVVTPQRASSGSASAICNDGLVLLDNETGGARVLVATAPGGQFHHLCVRLDGEVTGGGRLTIDTKGTDVRPITRITQGTSQYGCTMIVDEGLVAVGIIAEHPATVCIKHPWPSIWGGWVPLPCLYCTAVTRITLGIDVTLPSEPPEVTWTPDEEVPS